MKVMFFIFTAFICGFQVEAQVQGPSTSEKSFCSDRQDMNFIKNLTLDSSNLMSLKNRGGIGRSGVCWWHSRFQRNALYLTIYKPGLPRPDQDQVIDLVHQIRDAENVVVIPGYKNFSDFTFDNKEIVQAELEQWQKDDSLKHFAWIDGLSGSASNDADEFKMMMDELYNEVEVNKNIAYNKLQIPGIRAHSWLVLHMEKVAKGYDLEILDSNVAEYSEIYQYREGDESMSYHIAHADVGAARLQNIMDQTYQQMFVKNNFLRTPAIPGFEFHRWTLLHLSKIEGGYNLAVRIYFKDKNPQDIMYEYHNGDMRINFSIFDKENINYSTYSFAPYLEKVREMEKITNIISSQCSGQISTKKENSNVEEFSFQDEIGKMMDFFLKTISSSNG